MEVTGAFSTCVSLVRFYVPRWYNSVWNWLGNQRCWNVLDNNENWFHSGILGWDRICPGVQARLVYLGCVSLGKSKSEFLYPKTDFAFLYLNPKMD